MAMENRSMMPAGITLGNRFEVEAYLGQGGFGFVSQCRNLKTGERVAIKVNKSDPNVVRTTRMEIAMLRRLRCLDPDTCNIIKWNGFFFDKEQICLNFELLDQSLRDYLHEHDYLGLPMTELKPIIHQLATALYHLDSLGIAHADLKPDNIMIVDRNQHPLRIKLIDFGLALPASQFRAGLNMGTTAYKAPELMIHAPFWEAIDMWSLGITIAELALGRPLYPGWTDYDVLNFIIQTQGQPEDEMLNLGTRVSLYFKSENNGQQHWRFKTQEEFAEDTDYYGEDSRYFVLSCLDEIKHLFQVGMGSQSDQHLLVDLIKRMLTVNPDDRITPLEVLQHPLFAQSVTHSSHTDNFDRIEEVEDGTPEPSQQCSGYPNTGPEMCRVIQDNQEETSKVSQLSSSNDTVRPDNVQCGVKNSPGDTLSEVSIQCSDYQSTGSGSCQCRIESPSVDTGIKTPHFEEEMSEFSGQSSLYETMEPENFFCGVMSFSVDTLTEPNQQCSDYQTAGSGSSQSWIESLSVDTGIKTPHFEEEMSEFSGQSSLYETMEPENFFCGVKNSPGDTLSEVSIQCSDYQTTGSGSCQCRIESPSVDTGIKTPHFEEEMSEFSGQSSSYETMEPENFSCGVMSFSVDTLTEPNQQCSDYETAGSGSSQYWIESLSVDTGIKTPHFEEETSQLSGQSSLYEWMEPENFFCGVMSFSVDTLTEPSQQCSDYQTAGSGSSQSWIESLSVDTGIKTPHFEEETSQLRGQSSLYETMEPEIFFCGVMSFSVDTLTEPSQQCSDYQTAGSGSSQYWIESLSVDTGIKTPHFEEEMSEFSGQSSLYETMEPENFFCGVKNSPGDTLSEVSIQCSDYQTTGSGSSQYWIESLSVDTGIKTPHFEEETSQLSGQSSLYEWMEPDNFFCGVMSFSVDTLTEPNQQCSDYQTAGSGSSQYWIESLSVDTGIKTPHFEEEMSEFSGQSSSYETMEPENFSCGVMSFSVDTLTEPSQQCSDYQTAGSGSCQCRIESPNVAPPPPEWLSSLRPNPHHHPP